MERRRRRRVALVVALLALACIPDPSAAARKASLTGASCESLSVPLDVPAENVEPYLPDDFAPAPTAIAGEAEVIVNTIRCDDVTTGKRTAPGSLVSVAVGIEPPNEIPGPHLYEVWTVTDSEPVRAFFAFSGFTIDLVEEIDLERSDNAAGRTVTAAFEAPAGAFEGRALSLSATGAPLDAGPSAGTVWHSGPNGVVALEWLESFVSPTEVVPVEAAATTLDGDLGAIAGKPVHRTSGFLLSSYELRFKRLTISSP